MKIDKELYERASRELMTEYDVQYTKDPDNDFVWVFSEEPIEALIEDLLTKIEALESQIKDIEQDRDENYRAIPVREQVE